MRDSSDPIAVLHVLQPVGGGVPRVARDLVLGQLARGWLVTVASPSGSELADVPGATHRAWEAKREPGPSMLAETRALRRILREVRPDVVHLHSAKAGLAGRIALRGRLPTIYQPHAWSFEAATGATRRLATTWERIGARWTDALACVSEHERATGENAGIEAPWRVIPNGVDLDAVTLAGAESRRSARAKLGLGDEPLAVCVGRLSRQKGQDVLLDAWREVRERVGSAQLALVGSGPDEEVLRARAGAGVHFAGERSDVPDWLAAANVVVLSSRWEGMSLALLEAMARGRSIVATDVAGMREALGGTGAVVAVESARALADAIAPRLLDPQAADEEGRRARSRAEVLYDVRQTVGAFAALTQELVAQ